MKLSKRTQRNIQILINSIKHDLKEHGFTLQLRPYKQVRAGSVLASGYFDDETKRLVVAIKRPVNEWVSTLIHEYNHFRQFIEKSKVWTDYESGNVQLYYDFLDDKVQLESTNKDLIKAIRLIQNLELDCEKRTIDTIKVFALESLIPIKEYMQRSIAYVTFYDTSRLTKKWYISGKEPYSLKAAWSKMPKSFDKYKIGKDQKLIQHLKKVCF